MGSVLVSVSEGMEQLEKEAKNMEALEKSIFDYKWNHINRNSLTKERLSEMTREIAIVGKDMVKSTDENVKKLICKTEPYIRSGVPPEVDAQAMLDKCIELKGTIAGIKSAIKKNEKIAPIVLKHHKELNKIEEMALKALALQEKLERNKRLSNEFPEGTPLHELIVLSTLLLSLDRSTEISDYYKKKFGELETKIGALFEGMSEHVPTKIGEIASNLSTQSSLSNGEINLQSINDGSEVPVDATEVL